MTASRNKPGFTIVELLIVIVVIAILAAISIVAYNGIQERARMSSALSFEHQLRSKYLTDATGDWSFDECSGTSVKNTSNTSTTDPITYVTAPAWVTDTPSGKGCALNFSGNTRIETQATLGSTYYVKAAWVRIAPTSACVNIMSRAVTNGADAPFWFSGCRLAAGVTGGYTTVLGPQTLNDGKWHYVAVIWENNTLTLYTDGKQVAGPTTASTTTPGAVSIGSHAGSNYFIGDIDNPFAATQ